MSFVASVVVATHDRAEQLPLLLAGLEAQQVDGPFEVIIVDDSSTDDTWTVLNKLAADASMPVRALKTERNSGPATARNLGWRSASAEIVVFTDDDCVPQPGWLQTLVDACADVDVVQGTTLDQPGPMGPFFRSMWIGRWSDLFETCNMAYRRELLERLGGFDESFPRPYGEDCDLGWRALELGATTRFVTDAVVLHASEHGSDLRDFVAELRGHARKAWMARAVKRHPGLRRRLHRRWFYAPAHPLTSVGLVATAVALAAPQRRRSFGLVLALAAWTPYLRYRTRIRPRATAKRSHHAVILPSGLVSDVTELGAVLVGAIRFRTVLI